MGTASGSGSGRAGTTGGAGDSGGDGRLDRFARDGWFVADGVFSPDECDRIVELLEATDLELPLGRAEDGPMSYRPMLHRASDGLRAVATDRRWARFVLPIVGPDARLYWEQGVAKPPRARTELPWHQDNGYTPLDPEEYLTCWLALDEATVENGCLWVLGGSHRAGTRRHRDGGTGPFRVGYDGTDPGTAVPVRKGSVLVFSSLLLHRSGPNTSDLPRHAWVIQFCPAHARSALSGNPMDDRLRVAEDGRWLDEPVAERPFDLLGVLANYDRR